VWQRKEHDIVPVEHLRRRRLQLQPLKRSQMRLMHDERITSA
jgi:hypothetical protein